METVNENSFIPFCFSFTRYIIGVAALFVCATAPLCQNVRTAPRKRLRYLLSLSTVTFPTLLDAWIKYPRPT